MGFRNAVDSETATLCYCSLVSKVVGFTDDLGTSSSLHKRAISDIENHLRLFLPQFFIKLLHGQIEAISTAALLRLGSD